MLLRLFWKEDHAEGGGGMETHKNPAACSWWNILRASGGSWKMDSLSLL